MSFKHPFAPRFCGNPLRMLRAVNFHYPPHSCCEEVCDEPKNAAQDQSNPKHGLVDC
jgi:hypothetical protein